MIGEITRTVNAVNVVMKETIQQKFAFKINSSYNSNMVFKN